jgi:hypothetical protein
MRTSGGKDPARGAVAPPDPDEEGCTPGPHARYPRPRRQRDDPPRARLLAATPSVVRRFPLRLSGRPRPSEASPGVLPLGQGLRRGRPALDPARTSPVVTEPAALSSRRAIDPPSTASPLLGATAFAAVPAGFSDRKGLLIASTAFISSRIGVLSVRTAVGRLVGPLARPARTRAALAAPPTTLRRPAGALVPTPDSPEPRARGRARPTGRLARSAGGPARLSRSPAQLVHPSGSASRRASTLGHPAGASRSTRWAAVPDLQRRRPPRQLDPPGPWQRS